MRRLFRYLEPTFFSGLIEDPCARIDLPLDIRGTAFQQRVWEALGTIPAGSTASYAQIAEKIGAPRATRAVAQACGAEYCQYARITRRLIPGVW